MLIINKNVFLLITYGGATVKKGIRKFTADETALFCSQLSMLINAGISLYEGIGMLYDEMEDPEAKEILKSIDEKVQFGGSLSDAIKESGAFPVYMTKMVEVGEQTGKLEEILKALASYYERENAVNSAIKSVIMYPVMLLFMMAVILLILIVKILPMFNAVFLELDNKTQGTSAMMNASLSASHIAGAVVFTLVVALLVALLVYRFKKGADAFGAVINKLPMTASLAGKIGRGRFLSALSVMISSGMETGDAIERAAELPDDKKTVVMAEDAKKRTNNGEGIDEALGKSGILSGMESKMLTVGLKSGVVEDVLVNLSNRRDEEINNEMNGFSAKLETGLVIILSVLVGVILITAMLPLISVIASI